MLVFWLGILEGMNCVGMQRTWGILGSPEVGKPGPGLAEMRPLGL